MEEVVKVVEYAYLQSHEDTKEKGKGRLGISEEAALFAGTHRESGEHMVFPDILDFASRKVEKDTSIMKQIRKAREERHLAPACGSGCAHPVSLAHSTCALSLLSIVFNILSRDDDTPRRA